MTRNKKGFTLVELVIVIAVIAILAGVMIAVFSGVVKRANESAELQKVKNEEIAQKADDILKKIDNANWFSWEDFENSLAAKLEKTYEKYAGTSSGVTAEQIEKTVKKALEEYGAQAGQTNTSLTEAQVKAIVENALAKASLGGVTENQVRTIVNTAVAGISTVSKAQVQAIVDAAVAKGLTAQQVAQVVADAKLATATSVSDLDTKVGKVITDLATVSENALTKEDVEAMIKKLLPVTVTVKATETQTLQEAFNEAVTTLVSGSTIIVESETTPQLTLTTDDVTTLTIKGVDVDKLTVNAPNATIYVLSDVGTVEVTAVAQNSLHLFGSVQMLKITKGRIVIEEGVVVQNVEINSEGLGDKVVVVLEKDAEISTALHVKKAASSILVENKGKIELVTASKVEGDVPAGKAQVVNEDGGVVTDLDHSHDGNKNGFVVISGDNAPNTKVVVRTIEELRTALSKIGTEEEGWEKIDTIVFGNDITAGKTDNDNNVAINVTKSVAIDGDGYTLTTSAGRGIWADASNISLTVKNLTIVGSTATNLERAVQVNGGMTDVNLNLYNVTAVATMYTVNICNNASCYLNVEDSTLTGWGVLNAWSAGYLLDIKNSKLYGIDDKGYNAEGWNDFATVVLEGDTTRATDMHCSNNVINIENTLISAKATTGNHQALIGFNTGCTDNVVNLVDCTLELNGANTYTVYDQGTNNILTIDEDEVDKDELYQQEFVANRNILLNYTYSGNKYWAYSDFSNKVFGTNYNAIALAKDVELTANVNINKDYTIYFQESEFTGTGKFVIKSGKTITTDKAVEGLFVGASGTTIQFADAGDGTFTYTAVAAD